MNGKTLPARTGQPNVPSPARRRGGFRRDLQQSYDAALTTFGALGVGVLVLLFVVVTYRLGELAHLVAIGAIR